MLPEPIFGNVHMYGVMIAMGILCAFVVLFLYTKKKNVDSEFTDFIFYNGLASIAVGFGFATLFQATYNYIEHPEAGFQLGSGMTFIGGLIGGVICFLSVYFIFRKRYTTRLHEVISILPCSILVAHSFGRIGCFFAGCCYGKETDSAFGVLFPELNSPVHPAQLYEAAFLLVMFAVCSYLVLKKDYKHNLSLYLISYGIFRFLIEYLRGDERGKLVGFISPSQFWSVLMIIIGVTLLVIYRMYSHKQQKGEQNELF